MTETLIEEARRLVRELADDVGVHSSRQTRVAKCGELQTVLDTMEREQGAATELMKPSPEAHAVKNTQKKARKATK